MQLSKFLPYVLPHVPGCTDPFAEQAVRDAADEFCQFSRAVREALEPITLAVGVSDYEISSETAGCVVYDVTDVMIDGSPIEPIQPEIINRLALPLSKGAMFYTIPFPGTIRLVGKPTEHQTTLTMTGIIRPMESSTSVPDVLLNDWRDTIVSGALTRLMAVPEQPFTNTALVSYHRSFFNSGILRAANRGLLGNTKVSLRVQAHP
jgi:hypothetical protein